MKFTEEILTNWTKRSSDTEPQKIDNAVSMIKDAIDNHDALKEKEIEVFAGWKKQATRPPFAKANGPLEAGIA